MKEFVKMFKALSDENRLRILKILEQRPLCVCEITAVLGLATSTISSHLAILRDAGFIQDHKEGKWVNYELIRKPEDSIPTELLLRLLQWLDKDEIVRNDKTIAANVDRFTLCHIPDKQTK